MKKFCRYWGVIIILPMGICLLLASTQAWAEMMKGRQVHFLTRVEVLEVGDVADHIIGIYGTTGLESNYEAGEVASPTNRGTLDYIKGAGTYEAYSIATYEDGSTCTYKVLGTTRPDRKGKGSLFEATLTLIGGTGRFAGIQGEGSYTGRRIAPLDTAAPIYVDFTVTYTLPER